MAETDLIKKSSSISLSPKDDQSLVESPQNSRFDPSEVRIFTFKGIKGTIDPNDNRSDKSSAFKLLNKILEIGHPDLTPEVLVDSLAHLGYEIKTMDDIHLLKNLQAEGNSGGIKVYQNGTVVGYGVVPVRDTRRVLAAPETEPTMEIQKLAQEVIIFEEDEQPKQAIEAVVMMEESATPAPVISEPSVTNPLPSVESTGPTGSMDYSYILNQSNIDITK